MNVLQAQTVADWQARGYRGLSIPRCSKCLVSSWASWRQLQAQAYEDVITVAKRVRCTSCGESPVGLAVVLSTSPTSQWDGVN
jgi:hypothetical protein